MQTHNPPWKHISLTEKNPSPFVFSPRYCGNRLERKRVFHGRGEQGCCLSKAIRAGVLNSPSIVLKIYIMGRLQVQREKKKF